MWGNIAFIAVVALGIDVGWQPLPEGGVEYLIQIEPDVFERLKSGDIEAIASDVPTHVRDIRTYRVFVGTAELPRELPSTAKPLIDPFKNRPPVRPLEPGGFDDATSLTDTVEMPFAPDSPFPESLPANPGVKPISAEPVAYIAPGGGLPSAPSGSPSDAPAVQEADAAPSKPWLPLTAAVFAFFASFGINVYLGWMAWDNRYRYRELLLRDRDPATLEEIVEVEPTDP